MLVFQLVFIPLRSYIKSDKKRPNFFIHFLFCPLRAEQSGFCKTLTQPHKSNSINKANFRKEYTSIYKDTRTLSTENAHAENGTFQSRNFICRIENPPQNTTVTEYQSVNVMWLAYEQVAVAQYFPQQVCLEIILSQYEIASFLLRLILEFENAIVYAQRLSNGRCFPIFPMDR